MCSVHSRTGHGHALRRVRLAARQLTAVLQPVQGPLASARSCVPLRMRSITIRVSHLYRADPSSGHQAPMLLWDAGGCDDGSATRCTCLRACPRWPTLIRRLGVPCTPERGQIDRAHQASLKSATLRSLSERLTLVTAVTSTLLRHGRLREERIEPPWYSSRKPKLPPCILVSTR